MSNYSSLKATINANVKTNNDQEITGAVLNAVLNAMVSSLGAGYQYMGVATPQTDPGNPDQKVFWVAKPGKYPNFGNTIVPYGSIGVFRFFLSWVYDVVEISGDGIDPNLYNIGWLKSQIIHGEMYDIYGNPAVNADRNRLPLIRINKNFAFKISVGSGSIGCRCYNENKQYIGDATINADNNFATLYQGTEYVGIYWLKAGNDLADETYSDNYIDTGSTIKKVVLGDVVGDMKVSSPLSSASYWAITISIAKGTHFRIKVDATNGWNRIIVGYNGQNANRFIDSSNDGINGEWVDLVAPVDITSIGLMYYSATDSQITISVNVGGIANEQKKQNVLNGKILVTCGDSFTEYTAARGGSTAHTDENWDDAWKVYKTYPYWIAKRNGMQLVNKAVSGMTMTYLTGNSFSIANGVYTQLPDNADYIILKFGINDDAAHQNAPIGTIDDNTNTTFCGAWNVVLDYLTNKHTKAKFGILITNGADINDLTQSIPYMEATIAIAKKWGIAYLNEGLGENITAFFRTGRTDVSETMRNRILDRYKISNSDFHPCVEWHEYESTIVEAWLRTL